MTEAISFESMKRAVVDGDPQVAGDLARAVLEQGQSLEAAIEEGFAAGIVEVGRLWEEGAYFLPELMAGAEAMKSAMALLNPAIAAKGEKVISKGTIAIGTVAGDLHDIGKTLVATMLSASGFEVKDLGADVPLANFVEEVAEGGVDMVCMSALLTTTMVGQRWVVEELGRRGLRDRVKVMVGGAPVSEAWAEEIGADGFGSDAIKAVDRARALLEGS